MMERPPHYVKFGVVHALIIPLNDRDAPAGEVDPVTAILVYWGEKGCLPRLS